MEMGFLIDSVREGSNNILTGVVGGLLQSGTVRSENTYPPNFDRKAFSFLQCGIGGHVTPYAKYQLLGLTIWNYSGRQWWWCVKK